MWFSGAVHVTVMTGIYLASNIDRQAMLGRIENSIKGIFNNPPDAFYTGRAMALLVNEKFSNLARAKRFIHNDSLRNF